MDSKVTLSKQDYAEMMTDPNDPRWYKVKQKGNIYFVINRGCKHGDYKNYVHLSWRNKEVFIVSPKFSKRYWSHAHLVSFSLKLLKVPMVDINSGRGFGFTKGATMSFEEPYNRLLGDKPKLEEFISWEDLDHTNGKIQNTFKKMVETLPLRIAAQHSRLKFEGKKIITKFKLPVRRIKPL